MAGPFLAHLFWIHKITEREEIKMRKIKVLLVVVCALTFLWNGSAIAQGAKPIHLRIAAAGLGSSLYVYAAAIGELLKPHLPQGSTVDILPSPGGVANAILVADGRAELALTHSVAARWANDGTVSFKTKQENIRGIVGEMDAYFMAVIVTKKSGISSIDQIKEKKFPLRLMTVPVGGNGEIGTRHILESYGMSYEMLKSWGGSVAHTSRTAITDAMRDGHADAHIHIATPGHPAISEIALTTDVRFLPLKEEIIKTLGNKYGYSKTSIPAKTFKRQDDEVPTIGAPTVLIAAKTLPDEVAYWTAKVVSENKAKLVQAHAGLKDFNPEEAWKREKVWTDLHPGAAKYYKERGWMK